MDEIIKTLSYAAGVLSKAPIPYLKFTAPHNWYANSKLNLNQKPNQKKIPTNLSTKYELALNEKYKWKIDTNEKNE